jgi:hypothetical protein
MASEATPPLGVICATPFAKIAKAARVTSAKDGLYALDPPKNASRAPVKSKPPMKMAFHPSALLDATLNATPAITTQMSRDVKGASPLLHVEVGSLNGKKSSIIVKS